MTIEFAKGQKLFPGDVIQGAEVLEVKNLKHPGDHYLQYGLAHIDTTNEKYGVSGKYVTFLYNVTMPGGWHYGHYFEYGDIWGRTRGEALESALADFAERNS